jgi:hypothetical protein
LHVDSGKQGYATITSALLDNFGDDAGADGSAAFTNGKAQSFFHRYGRNQVDCH